MTMTKTFVYCLIVWSTLVGYGFGYFHAKAVTDRWWNVTVKSIEQEMFTNGFNAAGRLTSFVVDRKGTFSYIHCVRGSTGWTTGDGKDASEWDEVGKVCHANPAERVPYSKAQEREDLARDAKAQLDAINKGVDALLKENESLRKRLRKQKNGEIHVPAVLPPVTHGQVVTGPLPPK